MEKKITKKDKFEMVKAIIANSDTASKEELIAFIDREIELINKKSTSKSETPTQKANKLIIETIADCMKTLDVPITVTDLKNSFIALNNFTTQKLSVLLAKMVKDGRVIRTEDKKKTYFSLREAL
jgi:isoleucyl-tRNA synthetase